MILFKETSEIFIVQRSFQDLIRTDRREENRKETFPKKKYTVEIRSSVSSEEKLRNLSNFSKLIEPNRAIIEGERVKLISFVSTSSSLNFDDRDGGDIFHSTTSSNDEGTSENFIWGGEANDADNAVDCRSQMRTAAEASRTRKWWAELWTAAVAHTISLRLHCVRYFRV